MEDEHAQSTIISSLILAQVCCWSKGVQHNLKNDYRLFFILLNRELFFSGWVKNWGFKEAKFQVDIAEDSRTGARATRVGASKQ